MVWRDALHYTSLGGVPSTRAPSMPRPGRTHSWARERSSIAVCAAPRLRRHPAGAPQVLGPQVLSGARGPGATKLGARCH